MSSNRTLSPCVYMIDIFPLNEQILLHSHPYPPQPFGPKASNEHRKTDSQDPTTKMEDTLVPTRPSSHFDDDSDSLLDSDDEKSSNPTLMDLKIHFHGQTTALQVPRHTTISNLSAAIENSLSIEQSKQKIMISPKPGMLKYPF